MDIVNPKDRSRIMSLIKSKDTKPEMIIRKTLHSKGYRYVLHDKRLPGHPDIVFPKYNAIINIHGCFWHGHGCYLFKQPETRKDFWRKKISSNRERDKKNTDTLLERGWRVCIIWECSIKGNQHFEQLHKIINTIENWLVAENNYLEINGGSSRYDMLRYRVMEENTIAAERPIEEYPFS